MGNCYTGAMEFDEEFDQFKKDVAIVIKHDIRVGSALKLMSIAKDTGLTGNKLMEYAVASGVDLSPDSPPKSKFNYWV